MRPLLPSLALVLCLLLAIRDIDASAFSLSNIISTNCKYNEAGNQYVEVSLLRRDLEGLGVKSVNSLRLRENGPQCSYHHCRGHDRWMWRFNGSQCGSQLLVEDDRKIIANVLFIEEKNSIIRDVAIVMCSFSNKAAVGGSKAEQDERVTMPHLNWSIYHTDDKFIPSIKPSAAITFNQANTYVGDWTEKEYLQLIVRTENISVLEDLYNRDIMLAVYNCSLDLKHEGNGSEYSEPLVLNSCPVIGGSDFYGASASDFSSMIVHMNLAKQSERLNGTDVNFARLTCTASLCRDHGVEKYKQVPRCPGYVHHNCYQKMENVNPSLIEHYQSGLLQMQIPPTREPTPSTSLTISVSNSAITSTSTSSAVVTKADEDKSDKSVVLSPLFATVVCLLCFLCGCALVAIPWIVHVHCHVHSELHRAVYQVNSDETVEEGQCNKDAKSNHDAFSLDSGNPGSCAQSPARPMSG
ncbi:uncharacterized protein LOC134190706 [Corticium candelabrum]|uniref:uncharacterized protein LOC134190706 n=1 Tax=Corticium candelabrum TaxID=121492 RepID=UPI002E262B92|nr:uncharacterized protein LOC134190706 [Corticium candelabrum]